MPPGMPKYALPDYVRRNDKSPAKTVGPVPLPWGVALLVIGGLSGGLWLGIVRLLGLVF